MVDLGGRSVRYTIRFGLQPDEQPVEYQVVTTKGELEAASMAALGHDRAHPKARTFTVEVIRVEDQFVPDPALDLLDYWEVC
jgi:hypothetical protein